MLKSLFFASDTYDPNRFTNGNVGREEEILDTRQNQEIQQICEQIRNGDYTNDYDEDYWRSACEIASVTADSDEFAGGGDARIAIQERLQDAQDALTSLTSHNAGGGRMRPPPPQPTSQQQQPFSPAGSTSPPSYPNPPPTRDDGEFDTSRTFGSHGRAAPGIHPASLNSCEDNGAIADDVAVFFKGTQYNERFNRQPSGRANSWVDDMYGRGRPVAVPFVGKARNPDAPTDYSALNAGLWKTSHDTRRMTGVIVNPYTGDMYKTYEEDLPPPDRDYSRPEGFYNRPNRVLIQSQGGFDPRNPPPSKREVANQMPGPDAGPNVWGDQLYAKEINDRAAGYTSRQLFNNRNGEVPTEAVNDRRPVGYLGFQNAMQFVPYMQPTQRGFEDTNAFDREGLPDLTEMLWTDDRRVTLPLMTKRKPTYENYFRAMNVGGGEGSDDVVGANPQRPDALDIVTPQRAIDDGGREAFGCPDPGFEAVLAEKGYDTKVRPHLLGEDIVRWISIVAPDVEAGGRTDRDEDRVLPQRESYSQLNPIQNAHLSGAGSQGRAQTTGPALDSVENQRSSYTADVRAGQVAASIYQGRAETTIAEEGTLRVGGLAEAYEVAIGLPQDGASSAAGGRVEGVNTEKVPSNKQLKSFSDFNIQNLQEIGKQVGNLAAPRANLKQNSTIHSQRSTVEDTLWQDEFEDRDQERDTALPQRNQYHSKNPTASVGNTLWQDEFEDRDQERDTNLPQRNQYHSKNPTAPVGNTLWQNEFEDRDQERDTNLPQRNDYHSKNPTAAVDAVSELGGDVLLSNQQNDAKLPQRNGYSQDAPTAGVDPVWDEIGSLIEQFDSDLLGNQRATYSGETMVLGAGDDGFGGYIYDVPMLRPTLKDWNLHENPSFGVDASEWGNLLYEMTLKHNGYRGVENTNDYGPYGPNHVPVDVGGTFSSIQFQNMFNNKIGPLKESKAYGENMNSADYSEFYTQRQIPKMRNSDVRPDDQVHRFSGYANPTYTHFLE